MQNYRTRALVEAGIMSAVMVLIMIMSEYIPVIYLLGVLAVPIPITIVYVKNGFKFSLSTLIISTIIAVLFIGPIKAITIGIGYGWPGLTLGYCIKKNKNVLISFFLLSLSYMFSILLSVSLYSLFIDVRGILGYIDSMIKMNKEAIQGVKSFYSKMGADTATIDKLSETQKLFNKETLLMILPAVAIIVPIVYAYFNYLMTTMVFKRLKIKINEMKNFDQLFVPPPVIIFEMLLIIAGWILQNRISLSKYIISTGSTLFMYSMVFQGTTLVYYLLKNKFKIKSSVSIIILIISTLAILNIYMYVGIVDAIFNFRKIGYYGLTKSGDRNG